MKIKKTIAVVSCLLIALCSAAVITGCGSESSADSPYVGSWKATIGEYSGVEADVEDLFGADGFVVTFNGDGTCEVAYNGTTQKGTWQETEKGVTVDGSDDLLFSLDGDSLQVEMQGITLHFEKI